MTGERLHRYDLRLCRHALDNVGAHLADPAFAAFVTEALDPAVLAYAKALDGDVAPPPMLLTDTELFDLVAAFTGEFRFDRDWIPFEQLYRRSVECAADIREGLAKEYVGPWARRSADFADRLESPGVCLHEGFEVVLAWVGDVRRLLRAMGATALLPPPEGTFPTPTCPEPPALPPPTVALAVPNGPRSDDALTAALAKTQALQEEIRDLLLSQRRVQEFYSPAEAAEFLGKAEFTVREWCRLGRVNAQKRRSGRGRSQEWVLAHAELLRIQKEGLLPQPKTYTRLR
jgi:hypothetical protein